MSQRQGDSDEKTVSIRALSAPLPWAPNVRTPPFSPLSRAGKKTLSRIYPRVLDLTQNASPICCKAFSSRAPGFRGSAPAARGAQAPASTCLVRSIGLLGISVGSSVSLCTVGIAFLGCLSFLLEAAVECIRTRLSGRPRRLIGPFAHETSSKAIVLDVGRTYLDDHVRRLRPWRVDGENGSMAKLLRMADPVHLAVVSACPGAELRERRTR